MRSRAPASPNRTRSNSNAVSIGAEGIAQFVAEHRQEFVLGTIRVFGLVDRGSQLGLARLLLRHISRGSDQSEELAPVHKTLTGRTEPTFGSVVRTVHAVFDLVRSAALAANDLAGRVMNVLPVVRVDSSRNPR